MGEDTKVCTDCQKRKPLSDFAKCAKASDGLQWKCRACCAAYVQANKEHIAARTAANHMANRDKINEAHRQRYLEKRDDRLQYSRNRYRANLESESQRKRDYYLTEKDKILARTMSYRQNHPEVYRAAAARRRVRVAANMTVEDRELSSAYRQAINNDPCFYCGADGEHDDHFISLANGGTDHWWNLVRACAPCNNRKFTMDGDEFIALLPKLNSTRE